VLTPTLALTSIAGATPALADHVLGREPAAGPAPYDPMPEVVGISMHLTFLDAAAAERRHFALLATLVYAGLRPGEASHCDRAISTSPNV
jgi:hypothetical protein